MGELDNPSSGDDETRPARQDQPEPADQPTSSQPSQDPPQERPPAEPRTREEYASDIRDQGAPAPASDPPTPAATQQPDGQDRQPDARSSTGQTVEPRDRETYASDMRNDNSQGTGHADAGDERDEAAPGTQARSQDSGTQPAEPGDRDQYAADMRDVGPGDSQEAGTDASIDSVQPPACGESTEALSSSPPGDGQPPDSAPRTAGEHDQSDGNVPGVPAGEQPNSPDTTPVASASATTDQPAPPDPAGQADALAVDATPAEQQDAPAVADGSEHVQPGSEAPDSSASDDRPLAEHASEQDAACRQRAVENEAVTGQPTAEAELPDQPFSQAAITHYHADFKGQHTDLYTDGKRWAPGDRVQGENVVGEKPEKPPGDIDDLPPTGEQLLETENDKQSRFDAFRREAEKEENIDGLHSEIENDADTIKKWLQGSSPAGHAEQPVPAGPVIAPDVHHYEVSAGSVAAMGLMLGVLGVEGTRWGYRKLAALRGR